MNEATLRGLCHLARGVKPVLSMRTLYRRLLRDVRDAVRVRVAMGHLTFPMIVYPRDSVDFELFYNGRYEREEGFIFTSLCHEGDVVFDLGANIGYYTIAAARRVGQSGQVHAFEPFPPTYQRLMANIALNNLGNVRPNQVAVSNTPGTLPMYVLPEDVFANSGGNGLGKHDGAMESCAVSVVRLDDYVASHQVNQLDLIKMDIEGAEVLALHGMSETIARFRPRMLLEVNTYCLPRFGFNAGDLAATMREYGYRLMDVKSGQPFFPDAAGPGFVGNVQAIPVEAWTHLATPAAVPG